MVLTNLHVRRAKETGASKLSQRLLGLLLGTVKKVGQSQSGESPVTFPDKIVRHIWDSVLHFLSKHLKKSIQKRTKGKTL